MDKIYEKIMDAEATKENKIIKLFYESLSQRVGHLIQGDFCKRAAEDFFSVYWEMCLAGLLLKQNKVQLLNNCKARGPDFTLSYHDANILVEATAPGRGEGDDAIPHLKPGVCSLVEEEKLQLRLLNALDEKIRQYKNWKKTQVTNSKW